MKKSLFFLATLFLVPSSPSSATEQMDAGNLLKKARNTYSQLKDYTCLFNRKELFKGKIKEDRGMVLKYMKPAHYYLKWPSDLIEAIYVANQNDNKMVIHGGSIFNFLRVKVLPERALEYGRHTLVESDIGHVIDVIESNYHRTQNDKEAEISYEGMEEFDGVQTYRFKAVFPPDRGYYGHIIQVNLHAENALPLQLIVYGWKNELLEHYEYTQLKLNVGLKGKDFDIHNPDYQFNQGGEVDAK